MSALKKCFVAAVVLGSSCLASAQVSVNGQNVSVATGDGTAVNVSGSRVVVNTPKQGQTTVVTGSGRTAVNVGSGNVVENTTGSTSSRTGPREHDKTPKNKSRKSERNSDKDEAFWGKGGFWGENGK